MDEDETPLRANGRALIVGTILILSHLLSIQPSEVTGFGLKIAISEPAAVRGAIAVVFLHYYLIALVSYRMSGKKLGESKGALLREAWTRAKRLPDTGLPAKDIARTWAGFLRRGVQLHGCIVALINLVAFVFAVFDVIVFGKLIVVHIFT